MYTKAQRREYYLRNREKVLAINKEWRRKNPGKHRDNSKQWALRNPERNAFNKRRRNLRRMYGIDMEVYDQLFKEQGGVCAICCLPPTGRFLYVDHDHNTNKLRGLLCQKCNHGLGLFNDSQLFLRRATDYISRSSV